VAQEAIINIWKAFGGLLKNSVWPKKITQGLRKKEEKNSSFSWKINKPGPGHVA
jgi:hypothetical protein